MKIPPPLLKLTREHHQALSLANRAINTARSFKEADIIALCQQISANFCTDYQLHFQIEERCIFAHLKTIPRLAAVCTQLLEEHQILLKMAKTFGDEVAQNAKNLMAFGVLLKKHARREDREVFLPNINLLPQAAIKELEKY